MADETPEGVPVTPSVTPPEGNPNTTPPVTAPQVKSYDESYVKSLRDEAADNRKKNRDLQQRLEALENEKLSESERTQKERDDYKARAEQLEKDIQSRDEAAQRRAICDEIGIPAKYAARLIGASEADWKADAAEIKKDLAPPVPPNLQTGPAAGTKGKEDTDEQVRNGLRRTGAYRT